MVDDSIQLEADTKKELDRSVRARVTQAWMNWMNLPCSAIEMCQSKEGVSFTSHVYFQNCYMQLRHGLSPRD